MKLTEVRTRARLGDPEGYVAPPHQRSQQVKAHPEAGRLVKHVEPLTLYKRTKGGKTFYDFIEEPSSKKFKFGADSPLIYTYSPSSGNLSVGTQARWARQEILSSSPAAQRAGKRAAIPNDLEQVTQVVLDHYAAYHPKRPPLRRRA